MSARRTLHAAGQHQARIIASGGLDEYAIDHLVTAGAPIDTFAVGTKVGTSADCPFLDSAYKLVEYAGHPVMKLSTGKATAPAPKQTFRRAGRTDVVGLRDETGPPGAERLLQPVMINGRRLHSPTTPAAAVTAAHHRYTADLAQVPAPARHLRAPKTATPHTSARLQEASAQLRRSLNQHA